MNGKQTWLCYCGKSPIPLGQPCPRCGWDGHEDGDAAEIAWGAYQRLKDAAKAVYDLAEPVTTAEPWESAVKTLGDALEAPCGRSRNG